MLTITTYKKLEGLVLKDGLKVTRISELWNAYSIWLSDNTNIELDRDIHWENNNYRYYKMYIGYTGSTAETEFITIESINTLDRMAKQLLYIKEKYKTINKHTGLESGTEQPILNFHFFNRMKQIQNVCYFQEMNSDTVGAHLCRWNCQWRPDSPYLSYYNEGLKYFNEQ